MSCKVGNQTNSQDPQAVNSRVFVGNLNTFQCSKTDVERIFQRYGRIAGISMHKGFCFVQFTNPFDARSACLGEDGRLLWGQTLDVNMVAEPKAHQTGRKRQNIAKTGNDWDYYYDSLKLQLESLYHSYYAQVGFPCPGPRLVPPMKRARLHVPPQNSQNKSVAKLPSPNKSHPPSSNSLGDLKSYSSPDVLKTYQTPDILLCGNCRELFSEVEQLLEHKKTYCKLRFTCKCHTINGKTLGEEPAALLCSQCKDPFHSAWDLMVHVQAAHMLNIYQLGIDAKDQSDGKDGESGGCPSTGSGSPTNGFNQNGSLLGDNLMEDSHCQTDVELSPHHTSSMSMDTSFTSSSSVATSTTSTATSTSDCGHTHCADNTTNIVPLRNSQPRVVTNMNGDICNGINQMNGKANGCFALTSSPSLSCMGGPANNNNCSVSPYSQPMEASTQTSHSDNLLVATTNGVQPNVNGTAGNTPSTFDEHCGMVSAIKTEGPVHLPLTNGQVAGV